jgi:hypothetical protein
MQSDRFPNSGDRATGGNSPEIYACAPLAWQSQQSREHIAFDRIPAHPPGTSRRNASSSHHPCCARRPPARDATQATHMQGQRAAVRAPRRARSETGESRKSGGAHSPGREE